MDYKMYDVVYYNRASRLAERFKESGYILVALYPTPGGLAFEFRRHSDNRGYAFVIQDINFFASVPDEGFEAWLDATYKQCLESEVQNGK